MNTPEEMNRKLYEAHDHISDLEKKVQENFQSEQQKKKEFKK